MSRRAKSAKPVPDETRAPGAFMPGGSYLIDGSFAQRGVADRFVRAMVQSRRGPGLTPELAAEAIVLAKEEAAFPNHAAWSGDWALVPTSTSAEEAVKRCGMGLRGPNGEARHWCGQQWASGSESACSEPRHRASSREGLVASLAPGEQSA